MLPQIFKRIGLESAVGAQKQFLGNFMHHANMFVEGVFRATSVITERALQVVSVHRHVSQQGTFVLVYFGANRAAVIGFATILLGL